MSPQTFALGGDKPHPYATLSTFETASGRSPRTKCQQFIDRQPVKKKTGGKKTQKKLLRFPVTKVY